MKHDNPCPNDNLGMHNYDGAPLRCVRCGQVCPWDVPVGSESKRDERTAASVFVTDRLREILRPGVPFRLGALFLTYPANDGMSRCRVAHGIGFRPDLTAEDLKDAFALVEGLRTAAFQLEGLIQGKKKLGDVVMDPCEHDLSGELCMTMHLSGGVVQPQCIRCVRCGRWCRPDGTLSHGV